MLQNIPLLHRNNSLLCILQRVKRQKHCIVPPPHSAVVLLVYKSCGKNEKQCGPCVKHYKAMGMCSLVFCENWAVSRLEQWYIKQQERDTGDLVLVFNKGMLISGQNSCMSGENVQQHRSQTILEWELEKRRCQQRGWEKQLIKLQSCDFSMGS